MPSPYLHSKFHVVFKRYGVELKLDRDDLNILESKDVTLV